MRGSRVEAKLAVLKPLSAAISIGSGGPFGAEGPIIMTGGAFGSLIAQRFHLTAAERKTLLVAGSAAGMAATFGTPLAATLLAVELLLFEWKPRSFVPVTLACASAMATRHFLFEPGPLFPVTAPIAGDDAGVLLGCVVAGLGAGLLSLAMTKSVYVFEDLFARLRVHWMWWPALGGVAIGLGGLVEPRALGVGYDVIAELLHGRMAIVAILTLVAVKWGIWAIALGSGTSGGVLAPLLMLGAALGALLAPILPAAPGGFWPLVTMGAILGGTMRSPLTGILFAAEVSGEFGALLPLSVAVVLAHAFTVLALPRSVLTEKVARRGYHVTREYEIDPLEVLFVREVMTRALEAPPAGERAFAYRYTWLRDATFTLYALLLGGFVDEAVAWRDWLLRAVAGSSSQLHVLYGVSGERRLPEQRLPWLPGYVGSAPVRIGNAAVSQLQLDVYGEVVDALYQARCTGMVAEPAMWNLERELLAFLEEHWREPDEGLWEVRGPRQHFTHSKIMAWVAFDRAVKTVETMGTSGPVARWREIRDAIHEEVCTRAFDPTIGAFTRAYGSRRLDAAVLVMPQVGFLPCTDARVQAALTRRQPVDTIVGAVAQHEAVAHELALDRRERRSSS